MLRYDKAQQITLDVTNFSSLKADNNARKITIRWLKIPQKKMF